MLTPAVPSWSVPENRFVGEIAKSYDQPGTAMWDEGILETTVDCLVELADGGAAMEFAIGTGRVAVPLAAGAFQSRVSNCPPTCSPCCDRSPKRPASRQSKATWP